MKKLIITMFLCFVVFIINAQYISKYVVVGIHNESEYSWGKPKPTYLKINVKGNYISVSNESFYTVTELILENLSKKETSWNALDERNRKCVIKFKVYENKEAMLYVFYDNVAFGYYLTKPIKLDSL